MELEATNSCRLLLMVISISPQNYQSQETCPSKVNFHLHLSYMFSSCLFPMVNTAPAHIVQFVIWGNSLHVHVSHTIEAQVLVFLKQRPPAGGVLFSHMLLTTSGFHANQREHHTGVNFSFLFYSFFPPFFFLHDTPC